MPDTRHQSDFIHCPMLCSALDRQLNGLFITVRHLHEESIHHSSSPLRELGRGVEGKGVGLSSH